MSTVEPKVALFAKFPTAGEVKTRLIPAIGPGGAAALHRRLVERTVDVVAQSGLPLSLWCTGASPAEFAAWLGPVELRPQGEGDLGKRLARVPAPCILLGADLPDLAARHLRAAADALDRVPVAIGPAEDGGYYALALREPMEFLFVDMPWGGPRVLEETRRRLNSRGIACEMLATLADCDRPEDLARWPGLHE